MEMSSQQDSISRCDCCWFAIIAIGGDDDFLLSVGILITPLENLKFTFLIKIICHLNLVRH